MANINQLEKEGFLLALLNNGDGTFSINTHSGGAGVADSRLEIEGFLMQIHDNGDGTYAINTTTSTGATDQAIEWQGFHLKIHPTGSTDLATGKPLYAFVVNPV